MPFDTTTLLLVWFAGGFILALAWAAVMGQVLMGDRPTGIGPSVGALAVVGLLHPVGAAGALDIVRLTRTIEEPIIEFPGWALTATAVLLALSVPIAGALWILAEGP